MVFADVDSSPGFAINKPVELWGGHISSLGVHFPIRLNQYLLSLAAHQNYLNAFLKLPSFRYHPRSSGED